MYEDEEYDEDAEYADDEYLTEEGQEGMDEDPLKNKGGLVWQKRFP